MNRTAYRLLHVVVRTLARLVYRLEVSGAPVPDGGAVLAANHESVLDPFVLGLVTRRPVRFMAKVELWRFPAVGAVVEALGGLPVDRGRGDREAMASLAALLRDGWLVGIFPEGAVSAAAAARLRSGRSAQRSIVGVPGEPGGSPGTPPDASPGWHRGAAKLALLTGAPLVPVRIDGTARAASRGRFGFPKIRVVVGDPIPVEQAKPTIAAARELTERLRSAVESLRA